MTDEIYVSTDVETDGPIPGSNSMLSVASAAFSASGELLATYTVNLQGLPGTVTDPSTMEFWSKFPEAYAATRVDMRDPADAMPEYAAWIEALPGEPVFVGYPAGFDFAWVYWYLHRFAGRSPFSFSALDMKTLAMVLLGTPYHQSTKRAWPPRWTPDSAKHTHVALDDALEQGMQFCSMLRDAASLERLAP